MSQWVSKKPFYMGSSNSKTEQKREKFVNNCTEFICFYGIQYGPDTTDVQLGYSNNLYKTILYVKKDYSHLNFEPVILFTICGIPEIKMKSFANAFHLATKQRIKEIRSTLTLSQKLEILKLKLSNHVFKNLLDLHCWELAAIKDVFIEQGLLPPSSERNATQNLPPLFQWKNMDALKLPPMELMIQAVTSAAPNIPKQETPNATVQMNETKQKDEPLPIIPGSKNYANFIGSLTD